MKNPFKGTVKTLIAVLDRTPGQTRGQSLVELTITLPIFMVMLLGLVEIGWLANNYLTLVDVSREAGRYGSVRDPVENWVPGNELTYQRMDCDDEQGSYNKYRGEFEPSYPGPTVAGFSDGVDGPLDFYDGVACAVVTNMLPMEFDDSVDDIAVSVISYAIVDTGGGPRASVTGRFPARSNECADDGRDPFNPPWLATGRDPDRFDAAVDGRRGYVFRGNHEEDGCIGSTFSISEIEDLINRTMLDETGDPITGLEASHLPNNAIVLVEIFWEHEQLLDLPFFTWIGNPIDLHVWSFFPVSSVEPTATPE
ncbi:MAG: pilus assembly protein [Chloroflexi bacterium]|nr:pilus assembly protein [Chloroflexota bacterium]